jgi:hypothetical protein
MRSMVEGYRRVVLTCPANAIENSVAQRGSDHSRVPLHHPSGGPPPRFGEELAHKQARQFDMRGPAKLANRA